MHMARKTAARAPAGSAEKAAVEARVRELVQAIKPKFAARQRAKAALDAGKKGSVSLSSIPTFGTELWLAVWSPARMVV